MATTILMPMVRIYSAAVVDGRKTIDSILPVYQQPVKDYIKLTYPDFLLNPVETAATKEENVVSN